MGVASETRIILRRGVKLRCCVVRFTLRTNLSLTLAKFVSRLRLQVAKGGMLVEFLSSTRSYTVLLH